jgi:pimeloyl-ACP methyl ester carboxylesterase
MTSIVHYLQRPEGRIAYSLEGVGPLVIAVPGMGDLRSSFREMVPPLVAAGYRVAAMDLRGQGESDTGFADLGDVGNATDVVALIEELGGPAVILGNSMGGSAAGWVAAERPDLVKGIVLFGGFLRQPKLSRAVLSGVHLFYRVALAGPWGASFWGSYYRSLNRGTRAPWLDEHVRAIVANLREPGRLRSFRHLALRLDHAPVEARIAEIAAPVLSFVGDADPDFSDQKDEVDFLSRFGEAVLVGEAGHYVQAQRPDIAVPATLEFVKSVLAHA